MAKQNFNKNPKMDKTEWGDFESFLDSRGYAYTFSNKSNLGYRIWPKDAKSRWDASLSHLWIYVMYADPEDHSTLYPHWGQATVRLSSISDGASATEPSVRYSHTNLTGPRKKDSHLHDSMSEAILKRICNAYIADGHNSSKGRKLYEDMIKDENKLQRDEYLREWTQLLDAVEAAFIDVLWQKPWSLRAEGQQQPDDN
ncbi:hypothetical protein LX32DRAFT_696673 [Colletotrichum zoysiae]|uniref:Uncharacterized protein n=1 Tax=Colletotrichum zoysiae TaxID=1216348 RepID=A0AAD9M0W5_9PEZI|nr:hypothetical protein LX32DRAFT_696673 [Colletotrichum zoysiae]